jgi:hypothetical protein
MWITSVHLLCGSVYGPDILLTSAYYDQFNTLTWYQLCLGQISLKWSRAVSSYHASLIPNFDGPSWASAFISILWNFTRQLWHHRNQIVHGLTVDNIVSTQMRLLHDKVEAHYNEYYENPSYVLPRHEHLFTQRSLDQRLQLSNDSINCWLRSVHEARHILEFQQRHLQEMAAAVFRLFWPSATITTSDTESSYIPSSTPSTMSFSLTRTPSTLSLTDCSLSISSEGNMAETELSCSTESSTVLLNNFIDSDHESFSSSMSTKSYQTAFESQAFFSLSPVGS